MTLLKRNCSDTYQNGKALFKTIAIGVNLSQHRSETELNSKYNQNECEFTAKEQSEGVNGYKIAKRRGMMGRSKEEFLLKTA